MSDRTIRKLMKKIPLTKDDGTRLRFEPGTGRKFMSKPLACQHDMQLYSVKLHDGSMKTIAVYCVKCGYLDAEASIRMIDFKAEPAEKPAEVKPEVETFCSGQLLQLREESKAEVVDEKVETPEEPAEVEEVVEGEEKGKYGWGI